MSNFTSPPPPVTLHPSPLYWRESCIVCALFASLSIVASIVSLYVYIRFRAALRWPVLDALVSCFVLTIPASIDYIVASVALLNDGMGPFCELSFYLFQQFQLPEMLMETCFFVCLALSIKGFEVTYSGVRRVLAGTLLYGALAGLVPIATLPKTGLYDTPFDTSEPYCWMRNSDGPNGSQSTMLVLYKFFFGMICLTLGVSLGAISLCYVAYVCRRSGRPIPAQVRWTILYYIVFSVSWLITTLPRFAANHLSFKSESALLMFLAVVAPGIPMCNAIVFLAMEKGVHRIMGWEVSTASDVVTFESLALQADLDEDGVPMNQVSSPGAASPGGASYLARALNEVVKADDSVAERVEQAERIEVHASYDPDLQEWMMLEDTSDPSPHTPTSPTSFDGIPKRRKVLVLPPVPKPPMGVLLSVVGGYCDSVGFLTMDLFTAHVTGNTVLIGVNIANNKKVTFDELVGKILAIPVFCTTILVFYSIKQRAGVHHRRLLLSCQALLFMLSFVFARTYGPWEDSEYNSSGALAAGLTMVAGMAIQNSYQRFHLIGLPMTTFVTGNTNQLMHDTVELFTKPPSELPALRIKIRNNAMCILGFFSGTMLAAVLSRYYGTWAFAAPPFLVMITLVIFWEDTAIKKAR